MDRNQVLPRPSRCIRGQGKQLGIRLQVCLCLEMGLAGVSVSTEAAPLTTYLPEGDGYVTRGKGCMDPGKGCGLTPRCGHFCSLTLYFSSAEDMGQQCAKSRQRVPSVRISEGYV